MSNLSTPQLIHIGINNFAEILGVHQRTLRIWDKEGVLVPSRTNKKQKILFNG